jgi:opacity protein-like surface antigen/outer membrane protein OmpA-like peptidoglycan-associated protein
MIATAAFAVLFMSVFNLRAVAAAGPSAGDGKAVDSSSASFADPVASLPDAPLPESSMGAAMPYTGGPSIGVPRFELFLGYSYVQAVPKLAFGNRLVWLNGGSASLAFNLNRTLGLVADFGDYTNSQMRFQGAYNSTVNVDNANSAVLSYLFGPRLSYRKYDRITPFAQVLLGGVHANEIALDNCTVGCVLLPSENSFALTAGGGLDLKVSHHFAVRLIQAEYMMTRFTNYTTGASGTQNDMRLSAGVVFRFGGNPAPVIPPPSPLAYSCSVTPEAVFPGEPIAVSGTALNLDPAKTAVYTWSVDGGTVSGTLGTGTINTTNVAAGSYTLKGHVSEGDKPGENADCTAPYAVKAYEPPTVSCSADPATVVSGDPSTITAIGVSPQNRPLTYSYSATAGSVSGTGTTATLTTGGVAAGAINITCNVSDDKGQTASGTTTVTVAVPAVAPAPATSALCSISFDRDARRPNRVDNEAKACLDDIALSLQRSSDAKLAIVGNAASGEKGGKKLAMERAVNTKTYLVSEKGIDASRIDVYTGSQDGKTVSNTLIPAGATFDTTGVTPVD